MENLTNNIKKVNPVDCGNCSHSKVCKFKSEVDKATKEISNGQVNPSSPFVLTITCDYRADNVSIAKRTIKTEDTNNVITEEKVNNLIHDQLVKLVKTIPIPIHKGPGSYYNKLVEERKNNQDNQDNKHNQDIQDEPSHTIKERVMTKKKSQPKHIEEEPKITTVPEITDKTEETTKSPIEFDIIQ